MVYMGDHVCGVDYNPAVTLGAALRWGVPLSEYWKVGITSLAQFAGGITAGYAAYGIAHHVSYPNPDGAAGGGGAVVFEALWTTLLVYVVCAVMTPISSDPKDIRQLERRGLAIGFTVAAGIFAAGPGGANSGGVFNPAMGTGIAAADAVDQGVSARHVWIYFLGPFIGSFLGSGLFSLLHSHRDPDPADYDLIDEALQNINGGDDVFGAAYGERSYADGGSYSAAASGLAVPGAGGGGGGASGDSLY
jgi:glycerol uptake facilitator-like aquaporin